MFGKRKAEYTSEGFGNKQSKIDKKKSGLKMSM